MPCSVREVVVLVFEVLRASFSGIGFTWLPLSLPCAEKWLKR